MAATVLGDDGEATKAQQVFLALKHVGTGVSAYMVGKAKKEGSYLITVTPAAIEKQIGKQVCVCVCMRGREACCVCQ